MYNKQHSQCGFISGRAAGQYRSPAGLSVRLRGSTYTFWTGFFRFLAAYSAVLGSMSPSRRSEPRGEWR